MIININPADLKYYFKFAGLFLIKKTGLLAITLRFYGFIFTILSPSIHFPSKSFEGMMTRIKGHKKPLAKHGAVIIIPVNQVIPSGLSSGIAQVRFTR